MRVRVIVNPAAGTADDRAPVDELRTRLASLGHVVEVLDTRGPERRARWPRRPP